MKLDKVYWVYQIECLQTGNVYIGQTGKPNPCWRWADHVVELRNGISKCVLLQAEWKRYPSLTQWRFQALDRVNGKREANHREAERVLGTAAKKRLNALSTSCISLERRTRIENMLRQQKPYAVIVEQTGISKGMISRIKKALSQPVE